MGMTMNMKKTVNFLTSRFIEINHLYQISLIKVYQFKSSDLNVYHGDYGNGSDIYCDDHDSGAMNLPSLYDLSLFLSFPVIPSSGKEVFYEIYS